MKKATPNLAKFRRLMIRLKLKSYEAAGLLEMLWHTCADNAPGGDVGRACSDEEIAALVGWTDDPEQLVEALVACGWLDRDDEFRLVVHDWSQHVPRWVRAVMKGREFADVVIASRTAPANAETAAPTAVETVVPTAVETAVPTREATTSPSLPSPSLPSPSLPSPPPGSSSRGGSSSAHASEAPLDAAAAASPQSGGGGAADEDAVDALRLFGFDDDAARKLVACGCRLPVTADRVASLSRRLPRDVRNRCGWMSKAIREDWPDADDDAQARATSEGTVAGRIGVPHPDPGGAAAAETQRRADEQQRYADQAERELIEARQIVEDLDNDELERVCRQILDDPTVPGRSRLEHSDPRRSAPFAMLIAERVRAGSAAAMRGAATA